MINFYYFFPLKIDAIFLGLKKKNLDIWSRNILYKGPSFFFLSLYLPEIEEMTEKLDQFSLYFPASRIN